MEIAFQTIAEVTVALFAVGFLLLIIEAMLPGVTGNSFCSIGNSISSLPLPSFIKPKMEQCSINLKTGKQELDSIDTAKFSTYVMKCWNDNSQGQGGLNHDCFEIFVSNVPQGISERNLTDYLQSKNLCTQLPDNWLEGEGASASCGSANKILWRYPGQDKAPVDITGSDVTVLVKYNAFDHRIEII